MVGSAWPGREKVALLICVMEQNQQDSHTGMNARRQELLFLPSNEAAPPKYEYEMKNEDYHNSCARCPSCHLLMTKRNGLIEEETHCIFSAHLPFLSKLTLYVIHTPCRTYQSVITIAYTVAG